MPKKAPTREQASATLTKKQEFTRTYKRAKSLCTCGHTGDGPNSNHFDGGFVQGHEACRVKDCGCPRFTWTAWCAEFAAALNKIK